eukprot:TRINITY_DN1153_c0_g1_i2.p1 TRINITY_DN1153_c0_g1~~TRINITY_DN1153_c0_g1_i2.p1  ORF type:complete len:643 (+),score=114.58 TRINITY_DN1153_c0_g1_i2:60-1988(+)
MLLARCSLFNRIAHLTKLRQVKFTRTCSTSYKTLKDEVIVGPRPYDIEIVQEVDPVIELVKQTTREERQRFEESLNLLNFSSHEKDDDDDDISPFPLINQMREDEKKPLPPGFKWHEDMENWFKEWNIDPNKFKKFPSSFYHEDNPITRVDHPLFRKYKAPGLTDEELAPRIDQFKVRTLLRRQIELEMKATDTQQERFKETIESVSSLGRAAELVPVMSMTVSWFEDLRRLIEIKINQMVKEYESNKASSEVDDHRMSFLTSISPDKLAIITAHEILGANFQKSRVSLAVVGQAIGESIRSEANYDRLSAEEKMRYHAFNGKNFSVRKINSYSSVLLGENSDWPRDIKTEIGIMLVNLLVQVATFEQSSFDGVSNSVTKRDSKAFFIEEIMGRKYLIRNDDFLDHITDRLHMSDEHIRHYPMVFPPKPWLAPDNGGYYTSQAPLIRYLNYKLQVNPLFQRNEGLDLIYRGLNALGNTGWRINKRLLDICDSIWELGGGMVEIPPRFEIPAPEPGPEGKTPQWAKAVKRINKTNAENHSLRLSFLLKYDVLVEFKNEQRFYYPHNMDFRGRVYPIPAHLNHMGSDFGRGILEFANGRRLGKRGLYWLQIHLANLAGIYIKRLLNWCSCFTWIFMIHIHECFS